MKIGIGGAGGKLGGSVMQALHAIGRNHDIVAITRDPAKLNASGEVRVGDYDKPETLAGAYAGLDRLLLIHSPDLRPGVRGTQIVAAVDAAVAAGVGHIYLVSATGTRERAEPAMGAAYWEGEKRLMTTATGAWTILRTNYFAETFAEQAGMAAGTGHLPGFAENRVAFVSRDDVAAACVGALVTEGHDGAIYNLTGPEPVTGEQRAALLGDFASTQVDYLVLTEEQLRGAMGGAGLPPFVIDAVASMHSAQADGDYDIVTGDVEKLAGRSPRSLRDVLAGLYYALQPGPGAA